MELHFHYDVACPHAWLAAREVDALAVRTGATVVWKPVLLGGLLRAAGSPDLPAEAWAPARVRMLDQDLARQAALRGAPLSPNRRPPVRSLNAMRLIVSAPEHLRPALSLALFAAIHVQGRDLARREELARIARDFDLDPARIDAPAVKAELRDRTDQAVARGIFGVPSFWLPQAAPPQTAAQPEPEQDHLWWGADRLHLVQAALLGLRSRAEAPPELALDGAAGRPAAPGGAARLDLFHDFSSPFSYLGFTQARRVAQAHGASLRLRPMLLGAVFRAIGTPNVPMAALPPVKARYYLQDLHDWAAWWGVPFSWPAVFPIRTVTALRVSLLEPRAAEILYPALWARGRDIGDPTVLRAVLADAGLDAELVDRAGAPEVKAALRANTDEALALGACGAPTFHVQGEGPDGAALPSVLIWGQDRLDMVGTCLDGWRPPA